MVAPVTDPILISADPPRIALQPPAIVDISEAERRILIAYLETGNTRDAAAKLDRSVQTVKNTLANVRSRLGVRSTAQAVFLLHDKLAA